MLYLLAFLFGFICGMSAVWIDYLRHTYHKKKYGFSDKEQHQDVFSNSDDQKKYAELSKSVDGRDAAKEFKQ